MHQPRDYQAALENDAYAAWGSGARNVLAVLPTGGGKTFVFSRIAAAFNTSVCASAHRNELVGQMSIAMAREGVRHKVIGPDKVRRACVEWHMEELGRSYYDPNARVAVAGVDTLVNHDPKDPWCAQVGLWIQDEAHHVLKGNKWGTSTELFPNARGLGVTATPLRADGKGLGRHADGLFDVMVEGPPMRELIDRGYLTEYRIFAPPSDLDLSTVTITDSGDYSPPKLKAARRASHITGDVVKHYQRAAAGKLGVTFDTDIESATETAAAYRAAGVPAEVVTSKTPDALRRSILRKFRNREVMQLVNVDLFGEGFDLPAIEVVSMARPTQSYGLYCLDPDTEVLTPRGWEKSSTALTAPDVIAFDATTGACRTVSVSGVVKRAMLPGERMFGIESPHLSVCVSDLHRMLVKGRSKTCVGWRWQTAEHVSQRDGMFVLPVAARGVHPGSGLSVAELEFIGWFLSDGSRNKTTNAITIGQSGSKTGHISDIRSVLKRCGFKFGVCEANRVGVFENHAPAVLFTVSHGAPRGTDKHLRGYERIADWCDKSIPPVFDRLTREELLTMLRTWNLGDGWNNHSCADWTPRTLRIACGSNATMADRLQALCVTRGLRCNLSVFKGPAGVDWHTAYIKDVQTTTVAGRKVADGSVGGKKAYQRSRFTERFERPDFVWCLTNQLGTLITRRFGKVAIVGNCQQFGRALRIMDGKQFAIILDHVGNVERHGLPDARREWTLDRRERRSRSAPSDVVPVRTCLNSSCMSVYERVYTACPYCGFVPPIADRSSPAKVDGDLFELDPEVLRAMRGEMSRIDGPARFPKGLSEGARMALQREHAHRQSKQNELRASIAVWAGWQKHLGRSDSESYRRFFHGFGLDVASAAVLGAREAEQLTSRIRTELARHRVAPMGVKP